MSAEAASTPLRLVIFDVDGTLVDSQDHIHRAMQTAFASCELPCPPRAEVLSIVGLSLPEAFAVLAPAHPDRHVALVEGYKGSFRGLRGDEGHAPLYPGAAEVLDALAGRADLLLGVATGKSRRGLRMMIEAFGFEGMFFTLQCADDHPSKPHPAMIEAALAETGCRPEDAVMIGDTSYDIEMARAAGVPAIGVSWGYHRPEALVAAGASMVLSDFAELPAALSTLWAQPA